MDNQYHLTINYNTNLCQLCAYQFFIFIIFCSRDVLNIPDKLKDSNPMYRLQKRLKRLQKLTIKNSSGVATITPFHLPLLPTPFHLRLKPSNRCPTVTSLNRRYSLNSNNRRTIYTNKTSPFLNLFDAPISLRIRSRPLICWQHQTVTGIGVRSRLICRENHLEVTPNLSLTSLLNRK